MSGGDWGLVGLGGSKHGPQKSDFFFFFFLNWWNITTNILLLPCVENLLPWPHYSFKSTDYFFPRSAATTSSPTCDFETLFKGFRSSWKFFMQQLKQSSSSLCESWSWWLYVCTKVNTSYISQKIQYTTQQRPLKHS